MQDFLIRDIQILVLPEDLVEAGTEGSDEDFGDVECSGVNPIIMNHTILHAEVSFLLKTKKRCYDASAAHNLSYAS